MLIRTGFKYLFDLTDMLTSPLNYPRNHGSTLIMHGCKVIGACGSGIQVQQ